MFMSTYDVNIYIIYIIYIVYISQPLFLYSTGEMAFEAGGIPSIARRSGAPETCPQQVLKVQRLQTRLPAEEKATKPQTKGPPTAGSA